MSERKKRKKKCKLNEKKQCLQTANDLSIFHDIAIHENTLSYVESIYGP